jgi:hypothetical protein
MYTIPAVESHLEEAIRNRTRRLPAASGKVSYSYIRGLIALVRRLRG